MSEQTPDNSLIREPEIPVCPCGDPGHTHTVAEHWIKAPQQTGPIEFARTEQTPDTRPDTADDIRARVEAAIRLASPDHLTPMAARIIRAAMEKR